MIKNSAKAQKAVTSLMLRLIQHVGWWYQIRAKRVGRLRLITSQA